MIEIHRHTEGDSRIAKEPPTIAEFKKANESHCRDVVALAEYCCELLMSNARRHDWTKTTEPYMSMFYRDLCSTIEGKMEFFDGEWSKLHYVELERHHLKRHCLETVNMFDVMEMICDCVAAGMARSGDVYDVDIPPEVLTKAVANTVELLKENIQVVN